MSFRSSIPIRVGNLGGRAGWDPSLQSFTATLEVFPNGAPFPSSATRIGTRRAEFITCDALVNHLIGVGLSPDAETLERFCGLGAEVAEGSGEPEVIGLGAGRARRALVLRLPNGELLGVNPRFDHPDFEFRWGDHSEATIETARAICELAWVRRPDADIDAFALGLTFEFLSTVGSDFSLSAVAVCDWFLTDSSLSTTLDADVVEAIGRSIDRGPRRDRAPSLN